jgi:transcriptional regulator with XRE-family HTH domain
VVDESGVVFTDAALAGVLLHVEETISLNEVAYRLKRTRAELGMTQRVFAEHVGVHIGVIWTLETAVPPHVKLHKLAGLAKLLKCSVFSLNPKARELRVKGGRKTQETGQWGVVSEEVFCNTPTEETVYDRPSTRRDCLSEEEAKRSMGDSYDGKGDGMNCARPCPFVTCKYHLYVDINKTTGGMKINFPGIEVEGMASMSVREIFKLEEDFPEEFLRMQAETPYALCPSCVLDIADYGDVTLERAGVFLNVTRERIRQIEDHAKNKMRGGFTGLKVDDLLPEDDYDDSMELG